MLIISRDSFPPHDNVLLPVLSSPVLFSSLLTTTSYSLSRPRAVAVALSLSESTGAATSQRFITIPSPHPSRLSGIKVLISSDDMTEH